MMRAALVIAALLAGVVPAAAQCFAVTPSGRTAFKRLLTAAEQCVARAEGRRRACSEATVPEGTPGAIDAALARELLPHLRREFAGQKCERPRGEKSARKSREARRVAPPRHAVVPTKLPRPVEARKDHPANLPLAPVDAAPAQPEPAGAALPPAAVAAPPPPETSPPPPAARRRGFLGWLLGLIGGWL